LFYLFGLVCPRPKIHAGFSQAQQYQAAWQYVHPYPDVLTVAQVCEVTGYQRHTILKWCSKGLLKTILQTPKYMIPKVWLLEFVTSDFFNEISRKCGKHYAAIKEISSSRKAR